jgi:hypothetical protein
MPRGHEFIAVTDTQDGREQTQRLGTTAVPQAAAFDLLRQHFGLV